MNQSVSDRFEGLIDVNRRGLLKGLAAGSITGFSLPVEASADESVDITVSQNGTDVATVSPITTDRSIEDFYRYDEIDGASANTPMNLREDGASKLFFYRQPGSDNPISLVVIHDAPNNGNGGDVRFDFGPDGLPSEGSWAVEDDPDEPFSRSYADWGWAPCCTDGGAYRGGFSDGFEVTIDPSFTSGIGRWDLLGGDGSVAANLSSSDPVTLQVGRGITDDLDALVDEKIALADRIDTNAVGLMNDRERVEPALDDLTQAAKEDGRPDREEVLEAIQRMVAGERVTDAVLAGAGPGSSPHLDVDTNISNLTSEYAVNPILEVLFAGISILKAARVIPGLGGLVDDASRWLGNAVADIAGIFSETLERLIRSRARDAGLAIFEATEKKAKDKGKEIAEDEFKETRDAHGTAFIEDSAAVIFRDMLFNEERDFAGTETDRLDHSVEKLVDGLDTDGGFDLSGDTDQALEFAENRVSQVNDEYETIDHDLTDSIIALVLKNIGILQGVLIAVAFVASVTGVLSAAAPVAAAGAGLLGLGIGVGGSLIQWGEGATGILKQRARHQLAVQEILAPGGG